MTPEMLTTLTEQVAELVQTYSNNYPQFQRATYNETQVRVDFVNRFFKLLGWDVDNERGLPQHLREVTHEATVVVEEDGVHRSKKPDYSFKVGTEVLYFLETKKPAVNLTIDAAPAFQLRRYGWSGNLKVSVLTNFTDLYIYDCSVRPREGDDIGIAMIAHYHFDEYVERFEEIYNMLSKEAVLTGQFERHFGNIQGALRREPFDQYFLDQIRTWRMMLGEDILCNNPNVDAETLNIFVQRVLNRTIFLRICEDRCFENYESLKAITTYQDLRTMFAAADQKYDSGLFELLEEDRLTVSDSVIIEIFQSLYYPNNSYEFGVIDPYIIGQIYELFLDEALVIREDGHIETQEKPEVVDSQGAVNTPKNITDIIIEETLRPLYENRTPEEVAQYRIADICCGSGNFLLSAFEYIVNYHIEYYRNHDRENAERRGDIYQLAGSTNYILSYERKRSILKNNIFGVDIDPLAVEVSKFSLLLKALENSSLEEAEAFHQRTNQRILPNLDENIKNGNSLVNMAYARFDRSVYQNVSLMNKLKMFDWNAEFGNRKFDAIIGNPPYIRVQNMVHYSREEYDFYKSNHSPYVTAQTDTLDKYYLFIEKGLTLLNDGGMLGYIVPHKFMNIKSGAKLRELLSSNSSVKKILHFGTHQVFENRSTYTCILVLSKQGHEEFQIGFVQDWNRFLFNHDTECLTYPAAYISGQPWSFLPQNIVAHLEEISQSCVPLSSLVDIFVGVQTSADQIYIIHADREDDNFIYSHDRQRREFQIEKGILRKSISSPLLSKKSMSANIGAQQEMLEKAEQASVSLFALWDNDANPLCIEVLKNINASGLYELTERTNDILDENYVGDDPKVIALKKALSVPFDEMERYATYVSDSSRFATHQGVKGLEFPRVMVILDDTESRGFLFSYEKLFGAKKQTATDLKNEKEGKDTSNRRTARLFYVACTRAMESLAVVAYSDNPELVKNTALNNGWFSEDEIQIIETQSVL